MKLEDREITKLKSGDLVIRSNQRSSVAHLYEKEDLSHKDNYGIIIEVFENTLFQRHTYALVYWAKGTERAEQSLVNNFTDSFSEYNSKFYGLNNIKYLDLINRND